MNFNKYFLYNLFFNFFIRQNLKNKKSYPHPRFLINLNNFSNKFFNLKVLFFYIKIIDIKKNFV